MQLPAIVLFLSVVGSSFADFCYNSVQEECSGSYTKSDESRFGGCDAAYSGVHTVQSDLFKFSMQNIDHSFQYLLLSSNFAQYKMNREGFAKLYRKLSDESWEDAIDVLKYMAKRGVNVEFRMTERNADPNPALKRAGYGMDEIQSLSRALDMSKDLAGKTHNIHELVSKRNDNIHDAETVSFIENKFVHKHADTVRDLAGYANDLIQMHKSPAGDSSLSLFLFDEYLQKTV